MATKTRPELPKSIDPRVIAGALKRMDPDAREEIEAMAHLLAGVVMLRRDTALDLLLRCAWARIDQLDVAADLCKRLNGGANAETE